MDQAQRIVLVTGATGMLGSAVMSTAPADLHAFPATRAACDLAEREHVELLFERVRPSAVLHTAGFTRVDRAEIVEEACIRDNVRATEAVAAACLRRGLRWITISTDYVFDGRADRPYRETDAPHPRNVYGRTKLEAERAAAAAGAIIVRTSWLFGPDGHHFPGKILELARAGEPLKVIDDQRGCPTSTLELAPVLWELLEKGVPGIYHAVCAGSCTWYELARATLETAGVAGAGLEPCTTAELPRPAPRPAYSVLDCGKLEARLGRGLKPWRDALEEYLRA